MLSFSNAGGKGGVGRGGGGESEGCSQCEADLFLRQDSLFLGVN